MQTQRVSSWDILWLTPWHRFSQRYFGAFISLWKIPRSTIVWADCWYLTLVNPVRQGSKMVIPIYSPADSKRDFPLVCRFAKALYVSLLGFHHSYDGPNLLALVANDLHSQVMKDCSRQSSSSSWVLLWAHMEAVTQGSGQRVKAKSPSPSLPWNGSDCTPTAASLARGTATAGSLQLTPTIQPGHHHFSGRRCTRASNPNILVAASTHTQNNKPVPLVSI